METHDVRTKMYRNLATFGVFHQAFREMENSPQIPSPTFFRSRNPRRTVCSSRHMPEIYTIPHRRTMGGSPHAGLEKVPAPPARILPQPAPNIAPKTIGCYSCDWAYIAVESRGQAEVASVEQCSSSLDSPFISAPRNLHLAHFPARFPPPTSPQETITLTLTR
jgi:hypothetical protein